MRMRMQKEAINFLKAVYAGLMISISAIVYLYSSNRIVSAFLFSIGLIVILEYQFDLYTGKVGALRTEADLSRIVYIFSGNTIGCLIMLAFPSIVAESIWSIKLTTEPTVAFIKAMLCGILIQFCVHQHKVQSRAVSIMSCLIAVPVFILGGLEHSIADICFMISANAWSKASISFVLLVAIGNAVGAIGMNYLEEKI